MRTNAAFTLVELSIALLALALLIGGVLVGRNMIESAAIRAQIAQIDQFRVAVNTFQSKYDFLPGDIRPDVAAKLLLATRTGNPGDGNGDGVIEAAGDSVSGTTGFATFSGEVALFWNDLTTTHLISGDFSQNVDGVVGVPVGAQSTYLPEAKIKGGNYIAVFSTTSLGDIYGRTCDNGKMCYALINMAVRSNTYGFTNGYSPSLGITPAQAYAIDSKIDDGNPTTGTVIGGGLILIPYAYIVAIPTAACGSASGYALSSSSANVPQCIMNIAH